MKLLSSSLKYIFICVGIGSLLMAILKQTSLREWQQGYICGVVTMCIYNILIIIKQYKNENAN